METSTFPQNFKEAHVRPLLEKHLFLKTSWKITGLYPTYLTYLTWLFHPSPSAARHPVDEPALASIMTHDHAKDLSASELGPMRI